MALAHAHQTLIRMRKCLYLGLDAHTRFCVLAAMDVSGRVIGTEAFPTSEAALIRAVSTAPARFKYLAVEESSLAGWIANALRPYVDELIVGDRRRNALISRGGHKDDYADAIKLCRLHRMGELKSVFHTDEAPRVDFKIAVQQYLALRRDHARLKTQIKAKYSQAGIVNATGTQVFSKTERDRYLEKVPSQARRQVIRRSVRDAGRDGSRPQGGPHRLSNRRKLWRYCRLGNYPRSCAGKPLSRARLDRSGSGALKAVSYQC